MACRCGLSGGSTPPRWDVLVWDWTPALSGGRPVHQGAFLQAPGPASFTETSTHVLSFLLLPPGLPALDANDPEGKSDCALLSASPSVPLPPTKNIPSGPPVFQLCSWIYVLFSFLSDKNSPFYYGKSCCPSLRSSYPTLHTVLCPGPHTVLAEGLLWVERGQG